MDILSFWNQMTANPLLFIAVLLTLGVILVNGCDLLCSIMGEFENFKKSKKITRLLLSVMMLKKYVTECISHQCVTSPRIRMTLVKNFAGTKSMIVLKFVRTPANT